MGLSGGVLKARLLEHRRAYLLAARARRLGRYLRRRPHEIDFEYFSQCADREGLFLDIGANAGTSAMSFRLYNRRSPILSVEPNPFHEPDLRLLKRLLRRFDYLICGAGQENGTLTLHVPVYKGVPLTGEASLSATPPVPEDSFFLSELPSFDAQDFGVQEVRVKVRPLDDLNLNPEFVKIDVEGFELSVLRGLEQTIGRCRPLLLIEEAAINQVRAWLGDRGYDPFVYDPARRSLTPYVTNNTHNVFFVARPRLGAQGASSWSSSRERVRRSPSTSS